jgi:hypothetical protein
MVVVVVALLLSDDDDDDDDDFHCILPVLGRTDFALIEDEQPGMALTRLLVPSSDDRE